MEILVQFYLEFDLKIFATKIDKLVNDGVDFMERENIFWNYSDIYQAIQQAQKKLESKKKWHDALKDPTTDDEILTRADKLLEINELDEKLRNPEESHYVALKEDDDDIIVDERYERNHYFVLNMVDRDMKRLHAVPRPDGNLAQ